MPALHNSYLFHLAEQEEEPLRLVGIAKLAAQESSCVPATTCNISRLRRAVC